MCSWSQVFVYLFASESLNFNNIIFIKLDTYLIGMKTPWQWRLRKWTDITSKLHFRRKLPPTYFKQESKTFFQERFSLLPYLFKNKILWSSIADSRWVILNPLVAPLSFIIARRFILSCPFQIKLNINLFISFTIVSEAAVLIRRYKNFGIMSDLITWILPTIIRFLLLH